MVGKVSIGWAHLYLSVKNGITNYEKGEYEEGGGKG
jgi:hypothetical protein